MHFMYRSSSDIMVREIGPCSVISCFVIMRSARETLSRSTAVAGSSAEVSNPLLALIRL